MERPLAIDVKKDKNTPSFAEKLVAQARWLAEHDPATLITIGVPEAECEMVIKPDIYGNVEVEIEGLELPQAFGVLAEIDVEFLAILNRAIVNPELPTEYRGILDFTARKIRQNNFEPADLAEFNALALQLIQNLPEQLEDMSISLEDLIEVKGVGTVEVDITGDKNSDSAHEIFLRVTADDGSVTSFCIETDSRHEIVSEQYRDVPPYETIEQLVREGQFSDKYGLERTPSNLYHLDVVHSDDWLDDSQKTAIRSLAGGYMVFKLGPSGEKSMLMACASEQEAIEFLAMHVRTEEFEVTHGTDEYRLKLTMILDEIAKMLVGKPKRFGRDFIPEEKPTAPDRSNVRYVRFDRDPSGK